MISDETIKTLATKFQTTELNVEREYFQHLFLSYLSQQPASEHVFFKGGTALRILYNSPRFSEDLDFNSADISYTGIESLVLATLSQMEKENSKFTLKEGNPTSGGFFAIVAFEAFARSISIQIEISQREEEKRGEVIAITSDFVPPYNLFAVTEKQLVFEKIRALLQRKKPRDFYDLYFILRKELPIPDKKGVLRQAYAALQTTPINFEAELKQFLPKTHWAIIRDFQASLTRELERHIG
jgi:predicted nucleotidyltransferase component of viral defense system